jgi:tetratricopeptide (TPR) repeat protein
MTPTTPIARGSIQRFVHSAWVLLLVQLLAAAAAVAVTGWAALQVRPLLAERRRLANAIEVQKQELDRLESARTALSSENERLSQKLANAREASRYVSLALEQYHNRKYGAAIAYYERALELDPENPYVLDLKSYSQFRSGDLPGAIDSIRRALQVAPKYVYGYTELSRYACAAHRFDEAVEAFSAARARSPESAALYVQLLKEDGQFATLCAPVRARLQVAEGR